MSHTFNLTCMNKLLYCKCYLRNGGDQISFKISYCTAGYFHLMVLTGASIDIVFLY